MDIDKIAVGNRLRRLRENKGVTMQETADNVGASFNSVISNWEHGKTLPRPHFLEAYARYFGVSVDWIKYGDKFDFALLVIKEEFQKNNYNNYEKSSELIKSIYDYTQRLGFSDLRFCEDDLWDVFMYIMRGVKDKKINTSYFPKDVKNELEYFYSAHQIYRQKYKRFLDDLPYDKNEIIKETAMLFDTDFYPFSIADIKKNLSSMTSNEITATLQNIIDYLVNENKIDSGTATAVLTLLEHDIKRNNK